MDNRSGSFQKALSSASSGVSSGLQYIGNIPWELKYNINYTNYTISAILSCNNNNVSPFWSVEADYTIRTIAKKEGKEDLVEHNSHCFNSKNNSCNVSIGSYDEIFSNFVSNDKIEFKVSIEIKKVVGIGFYEHDFSKPSKTSDVVLIVEGKKIHVNKSFLGVHSSVFQAMFFSDFKEAKQDEIEMKDVDYIEFIDLLTFIYPGVDVPIHKDNLEYLLELADRFDMPQVVHLCAKYLMTTKDISNCRKFEIADKYSLTDLHSQVLLSLTREDINYLSNGEEFKKFKMASKDGLIARLLKI